MKVICHLRTIRGGRPIRDLEEQTGISRGQLSEIERGERLPREKHIPALEEAYGATVDHWYPPFVLAAVNRTVDGADE